MQSNDRFDQIDFRLDRLVGAVLTLTDTVSFVKDDLTQLKGIVQQQLLVAQEHNTWLGELKAVCQQQADTARRQSDTIERIITHLLPPQDPKSLSLGDASAFAATVSSTDVPAGQSPKG
jgi:hypothetical protein